MIPVTVDILYRYIYRFVFRQHVKFGINNLHHKKVPSGYTILFADVLNFPDT